MAVNRGNRKAKTTVKDGNLKHISHWSGQDLGQESIPVVCSSYGVIMALGHATKVRGKATFEDRFINIDTCNWTQRTKVRESVELFDAAGTLVNIEKKAGQTHKKT